MRTTEGSQNCARYANPRAIEFTRGMKTRNGFNILPKGKGESDKPQEWRGRKKEKGSSINPG